MVTTKIIKTIAVSVDNYERLKNYGRAGESINQAIGNLLAIAARRNQIDH